MLLMKKTPVRRAWRRCTRAYEKSIPSVSMDNCWRSIIAQDLFDSSSPIAKAEVLASSDKTGLAFLPQPPPTASMTIGMKVMPWARHYVCVFSWSHLKSSYLVHTVSETCTASLSMSTRKPLVTAKSQAAGGPDLHLGMKTSAGRLNCGCEAYSDIGVPSS